MSALANGGNLNDMGRAHIDGIWKGTITGAADSTVGGAIGGGWGAFAGGATSGAVGSALNGGNATEIISSGIVGGIMGVGIYHTNMAIAYKNYVNSGEEFDGHILSYKQFNGMSADFQRSGFWKREFGGVLTDDGNYVHRYRIHPLSNPTGKTELNWDIENFPVKTWATSHSHFAKPGTIAPDKGIYVKYHSPKDIGFDERFNFSSFVVNRVDASYNSVDGPGSTECYFSGGFIRSLYFGNFYGFYH